MNKHKGLLIVLSAPTGAGKTTVAKKLVQDLSKDFSIKKAITTTTRPPRDGEINGKDYHFMSEDLFRTHEENGDFLEVTRYDGHRYGSPKRAIQDAEKGTIVLMVTDRAGARIIKNLAPKTLLVWIDVPDIETVSERLGMRGTEHGEALARRIAIARNEIAQEAQEHVFDLHIINRDLQETVDTLKRVIFEKCL